MSTTKSSTRAISRIPSKGSSISRKSELSEAGISSPVGPKIECQDDVITMFLDYMMDFIIRDSDVIDPKLDAEPPAVKEEASDDDVLIKRYRSMKYEDFIKSEIVSVSGSNMTCKKDKARRSLASSSRTQMRRSQSERASMKSTSSSLKQAKSNVKSRPSLSQRSSEKFRKSSVSSRSSLVESASFAPSTIQEEQEVEVVKILFENGNYYEGQLSKKLMEGPGKFVWADGTIYEGDFKGGFPTGPGQMVLPDMSRYEGGFCNGFFHGEGVVSVTSSPMLYCGQWKHGKKHGKGWLLYEPNNWYDGEWCDDLKHGAGTRHYKNGERYKGSWRNGERHGHGTMIWNNNDYYKGEWSDGLMNGYGQYVWKAFFNKTFAFPMQNIYRGCWRDGKKDGEGTLLFGADNGSKLQGTWDQNFKHGDGAISCGNGVTVEQPSLFLCDKLALSPDAEALADLSIFQVPEFVQTGYYVEKILAKVAEGEKLALLREFEEKGLRNTIIIYLPKLGELYRKYAAFAAEQPHFEPVMIRMFLWQLYKDIAVWSYGLSLVDTDEILAEHPCSRVEQPHHPFEPIYFWQFLMSLVGVALATRSLDEIADFAQGGISAFIVKTFLDEVVFGKPLPEKEPFSFKYKDLVPIKAVYSLYKELGEPHTAKCFLRHTCLRRGQEPPCYLEASSVNKRDFVTGANSIPLFEEITFIGGNSDTQLDQSEDDRRWTSLSDFRRLGIKNILACLSEVCPLITSEGVISFIDYPLTFLEFYDVLLACIFLTIEKDLSKEKTLLENAAAPKSDAAEEDPAASKNGKKRRESKIKR